MIDERDREQAQKCVKWLREMGYSYEEIADHFSISTVFPKQADISLPGARWSFPACQSWSPLSCSAPSKVSVASVWPSFARLAGSGQL